MVEVEQDGEQEREWDRQKHLSDFDIPEIDEPASVDCRKERFARG